MLKNRIATHSFTKNLTRFGRHIVTLPNSVKRCFSTDAMQRITDAIRKNELLHSGEICFAVEANLTVRELLAKKRQSRARSKCSRTCAFGIPSKIMAC